MEPIWNAFGIDKPYCPKGLEYLEYIINNNNYIYIHPIYSVVTNALNNSSNYSNALARQRL